MSPPTTLLDGLINTLNKANNFVKDEKKDTVGIIDIFITSLKKENFSDDSSIDNIRDALKAREQERESEDKIILGIEPEDESTEDKSEEDKSEEDKTEEEEDIMGKFKWVLISISTFIVFLIIGGVMYWFISAQPEETIIPPNNQLNAMQKPPENVQEYSYLPFMNSAPNENHDNARRVEAQRVEAQKVEAQREEAQREEAQREEAQREEAQREEARREEAQREEAQREEAQRVEAQRVEAQRVEAQRVEAQREEMRILEQSKIEEMELRKQEQSNKEEMERIEQSNKEEMERLEKEAKENNSDTSSSSSSSSSDNKKIEQKIGGVKRQYIKRQYKKKAK